MRRAAFRSDDPISSLSFPRGMSWLSVSTSIVGAVSYRHHTRNWPASRLRGRTTNRRKIHFDNNARNQPAQASFGGYLRLSSWEREAMRNGCVAAAALFVTVPTSAATAQSSRAWSSTPASKLKREAKHQVAGCGSHTQVGLFHFRRSAAPDAARAFGPEYQARLGQHSLGALVLDVTCAFGPRTRQT